MLETVRRIFLNRTDNPSTGELLVNINHLTCEKALRISESIRERYSVNLVGGKTDKFLPEEIVLLINLLARGELLSKHQDKHSPQNIPSYELKELVLENASRVGQLIGFIGEMVGEEDEVWNANLMLKTGIREIVGAKGDKVRHATAKFMQSIRNDRGFTGLVEKLNECDSAIWFDNNC